MTNSVIENILSRYSVRQFTGEAVKKEDLETIVRAGMAAPSAVNIQPWTFLVVTDRSILDALCSALPYAKMLDKAGAAIIVCGIPDKDETISKDNWMIDCAAASQNILLAAHSLGYGAVWTAAYKDPGRIGSVRSICNIPANIIPLNVIPIGIAAAKAGSAKDKFRAENVHWNKF
jgi:nitroreductase